MKGTFMKFLESLYLNFLSIVINQDQVVLEITCKCGLTTASCMKSVTSQDLKRQVL